jgi:signal transduction histidine kinase
VAAAASAAVVGSEEEAAASAAADGDDRDGECVERHHLECMFRARADRRRGIRTITPEHLEPLIVLCPVAIAQIDARHHVRYCNRSFEALFGYRARDALGRRLEPLIGIGKPIHLATRARRKDQTPIDIKVDVIPNKRTGRPAGYWAIFQDVTALRSAEATLSKMTQTMIGAQERERFGIAKALHDDVAQRLTVLQIGLERLKTDLPSARTALKAQLEQLQTEAKGVAAGVRALSLDLNVPTLRLLAIDKALERLCDDITARRGIKIHFTRSHVRRSVPHDVSLALFRVVQDALNLTEASGVRPIRIVLTGTSGAIQLVIRDLGSVRTDENDAGLRLLTMRERVAMVNGTFSLAAAPAGGTEIDISVPLSAD